MPISTTFLEHCRLDSQVTMLQGLCFLVLLVDRVIPAWWLEWGRRMPMLGMRLSRKGVFLHWNTQLSMALLATGTIWKRFGITLSTMSFVLLRKSIRCFLLKHHSTQRRTGRRWLRSCLKPSMFLLCMLQSRPFCLSMPVVGQQVRFDELWNGNEYENAKT